MACTELTRTDRPAPVASHYRGLLARPEDASDGPTWSTDCPGSRSRWPGSTRPPSARSARRLRNRCAAIERLADALPNLTRTTPSSRMHCTPPPRCPDERCVYAVDGEPVVIWWGHRRRGAAQRYLAGRARRPGYLGPASPRRCVHLPFLVAFLMMSLMLAGGLFWWERHNAQQTRELSAAVDNALAMSAARGSGSAACWSACTNAIRPANAIRGFGGGCSTNSSGARGPRLCRCVLPRAWTIAMPWRHCNNAGRS
jgi:hypothetical protein